MSTCKKYRVDTLKCPAPPSPIVCRDLVHIRLAPLKYAAPLSESQPLILTCKNENRTARNYGTTEPILTNRMSMKSRKLKFCCRPCDRSERRTVLELQLIY